jgi:hypothetical protein
LYNTGELDTVVGEVVLEDITFAYPIRPELPVFKWVRYHE